MLPAFGSIINMPSTTIFLGSSAAAKAQSLAVIRKFTSPTLKFLPWWDEFTAGNTLLEDLNRIRTKIDGAILVFSPESDSIVRGRSVKTPSLNVLFEFGFFYGILGKKKVAMLKCGEFYLPSDFGGYIHIKGSKFFKRSQAVPIGKGTKQEFDRWITAL